MYKYKIRLRARTAVPGLDAERVHQLPPGRHWGPTIAGGMP